MNLIKKISLSLCGKIWNKKIKNNYFLVLSVWLVFIILIFGGWFVKQQALFDKIFSLAPPEQGWPAAFIAILVLFFEGASIIALTANVKPAFSLAVPFGLLIAYYAVCRLFLLYNIALDLFFPFFFGAIAYIANFIYNFLSFDKERAEIKKTFQYYLAPEYIEALAENPKALKLGGEEKELTVFFSDIRSFSTIAESMSAGNLVKFLNEYFSAMTDIVMANQGVIDKYIGDAIMAFWGAPMDDKNHADNALRSALLMLEKLAELNKDWQKRGLPEIKIGIGLNSDKMVVGNIGSSKRFNYTVMGDAVNLASRLEGLCKYYGAAMIISEKTLNAASPDFCARLLDAVAVKGKNEPVKIYEILADARGKDEFIKIIDLSGRAVKAYFGQNWNEAVSLFGQLKQIDKNKKFADIFIERCQKFKTTPPDKNWQGVWQMTEK